MPLLHDVVKTGNNIERLIKLLRAGEDPNSRDDVRDTPLHVVASRNEKNPQDSEVNLRLAKELIRFGANVNAQNGFGETPLIKAVRVRDCKMTEFLLEENAQVDARDSDGTTAFLHAILQCDTSLENGYDDIPDPDLHLVKTLLRYSPEVDTKDDTYLSPLMMAVSNQHLHIVRELLKHNASVNLLDSYNRSAIYEALDQENVDVDIVLELMRHDCQFNVRCKKNNTPMTVYFHRLMFASPDELEKATHVLKLFLFRQNSFNALEKYKIERIDTEKKCQLSKFSKYCKIEVSQMLRDTLSPNYTVYGIALRGFYRRTDAHVPLEVCDRVLDGLINYEYPVYCDMILSGIGSPYLNKKLAEICFYVGNTSSKLSNYDAFYLISFYLSHLDMLNMMKACQ